MKRFILTSALLSSALALFVIFFTAKSVSATTYYIAASGSDSNNGTAKTTPWLHAPGMPNCSSTCSSITPKAGDSFILRGGDTWTSSSFPWTWTWSGSSSSPIQVGGLDQTWFAGASWTRPILTGGGTFPNGGSAQVFFLALSDVSSVTVSWIEFTGFYLGSSATAWVGYLDRGATGTNITIGNNYFHGWKHAAGINEGDPGGNVTAILCHTGNTDATTSIYRNAIDGSDTAKDDFTGIYTTGGCGDIYQNYISWIIDAVNEGSIVSFHDNVLANDGGECYAGCASHNNVMEENSGPTSANSFFYNNYFVNPASTDNSGGIVLQLAPHSGQTSWFFNNVITNGPLYQANEVVCADALSGGGGTCTIFNNTMEAGTDSTPPGGMPIRAGSFNGSKSPAAINLYNNHTISSASPMYTTSDCTSGCKVTQNPNPNLIQSKAAANAQGYTLAQAFSFSPTASSGATVGSGVNETSLCTTIYSLNAAAGTACQSDTTYGIVYDTTTHTVTGPARTTVARPSSGAWDAGAYQWNSGSGTQPNPPTNVKAVAH
ncbi:MAG TPA: hypothetical protein VK709_19265 [Candidatus Saccharimonadales bacterium]|nr:hypothetical protein [Candidatus Saccharimonadales bacterium]